MVRHLTSDEKFDIINRYINGESSLQLSKVFNISKYAILRVLRINNIPRRSCRKFDEYTDDMILMYNNGYSACKIASILGMSSRKVYKTLHENGISRRNMSNARQIYKHNCYFFDDLIYESSVYFLGLVYSDGCITNHNTNYKLTLELQESDKHIIETFRDLISPEKQIYCVNKSEINPKWSNLYGITVDDKYIVNKLKEYGMIVGKTYNRRFPEVILNSSEDIQRHFIRGYFDGDGSIYYKKKEGKIIKSTIRITFASNINICENIGNIIKMHCNANYVISKNGNSNHITFMGRLKVMRILNWLYKDSNYYLYRKRAKYEELLELIESEMIS